jgi:hypothetical protein
MEIFVVVLKDFDRLVHVRGVFSSLENAFLYLEKTYQEENIKEKFRNHEIADDWWICDCEDAYGNEMLMLIRKMIVDEKVTLDK